MTDKNTAALAADHPEQPLDMVGRWYMVNKMGMATLCMSKKDAEQEAADAQSVWPHMGPHRAVQLVEAADVEAMRAGYDAARLEIESLQARIKTMAEEHADELMVAHLDGRITEPAGAQQPAHLQHKRKGGQSCPARCQNRAPPCCWTLARSSRFARCGRQSSRCRSAWKMTPGLASTMSAPTSGTAPRVGTSGTNTKKSTGALPKRRAHGLRSHPPLPLVAETSKPHPEDRFNGGQYTAAVKRASLDLSKALVEIRR